MNTARNLFCFIVSILFACSGPGIKDQPSSLGDLYDSADSFYVLAQYDSTLHYLDRCLHIDGSYAPAHYLLGKVYLQKDGIYNRRLSAAALRDAIKSDSKNPEYHYSLGQTLEAQSFALNALDEYKIAAALDTADSRPLVRIAAINEKLGLRYDDDDYFRKSLAASSRAAFISRDPVQFYKAAANYYQLGLYDSSATALLMAIGICDSLPLSAQCWLLLGTDMASQADFDSAATCFNRGLAQLDTASRAEIEDLRFLLTSREYASYLDKNLYERREFEHSFWALLDPDPTTKINEGRLAHYARFVHAELSYLIPDRGIKGWKTKRGELYIRYGPPTSQEFALGAGVNGAPCWIWSYEQFGRPAVFVFEDTFLNGEFDFPFPNKNWTADDYANDPARLAEMLGESKPRVYDYNPGTGPLRYVYQIRQFKGNRGSTELETFISIPHSEMEYRVDSDIAIASVRWRESLGLPDDQTNQSFDETRHYIIPAGLTEDSTIYVSDRVKLSCRADSILFSISIKDSLSGHAGISSQDIAIRNFNTRRVAISDIIMASRINQPAGKLDFKRHDLGITTAAARRFFISQPVWLYFELYNLTSGPDGKTSYQINLTVAEKRGRGVWRALKGALGVGNMKQISTIYPGSSVNRDENRVLMLDLSQLSEGQYRISLKIEDLISGENATASEEITIYR